MMPDTELRGQAVVLVPISAAHVDELRRILRTPEVHARWGDDDAHPDWPFDDPDATRYAVLVDGAVCGLIQSYSDNEPMYEHASIDIYLDPAMHGRGLGRDAVRTLARHLIRECGHHRITIDPAADNEAAIRSYAAVGFKPVGVMRQYERDADGTSWHDGLLMELLADDFD